jgi:hypothetical protein
LCIYSLILPSYHFLAVFLTAAERRGIIPPEIKISEGNIGTGDRKGKQAYKIIGRRK